MIILIDLQKIRAINFAQQNPNKSRLKKRIFDLGEMLGIQNTQLVADALTRELEPSPRLRQSQPRRNTFTASILLTTMPPELLPSDDEYASEDDSDFAPDAVPAAGPEDSSEEESEAEESAAIAKQTALKKRKRGQDEEAEDLGFENSGDEAIIEKGAKMRKKKNKKTSKDELEDEGGEGGLIKTRSMRAQECVSFHSEPWMRKLY